MSDSQRLHASVLSVLQTELGEEDFRNVNTMAWAITGVLLHKTVSLPMWASSLPDEAQAWSREQRFRNWLSSPAIKVQSFYRPFIQCALADWVGHKMYVGLDATSVNNRLVIARTAVIYRGRAVPLAWQVFRRKSVMLAFDQYAGLVSYTAQLIPAGVNVILLGDRGFRDVRLMRLAHQLHWHFRLRLEASELVWSGRRQPVPLDSWTLVPCQPHFLQRVHLTQQRYGPLNVAMLWDGHPQHDPWRIATDQRAGQQTLSDYALRMGIDLGFLDDKSAGFQLEDTRLDSPTRLDHLLLVTAWSSLYLVSLGTQLVAMGQRRLMDAHWERRLSYMQLGWRWLNYLLAQDAPLPFQFHLDPAPDPEPLSTATSEQVQPK
jgi:hypothetical protein